MPILRLAIAHARGQRARVIEGPLGPATTLTLVRHAGLGGRQAAPGVSAVKRDVVEGPTETVTPVPINTVVLHERHAITVHAVPGPTEVPSQGRKAAVVPVRDARRRARVILRGRKATTATMATPIALGPTRQTSLIRALPARVTSRVAGLKTRLVVSEASTGNLLACRPIPDAVTTGTVTQAIARRLVDPLFLF